MVNNIFQERSNKLKGVRVQTSNQYLDQLLQLLYPLLLHSNDCENYLKDLGREINQLSR